VKISQIKKEALHAELNLEERDNLEVALEASFTAKLNDYIRTVN